MADDNSIRIAEWMLILATMISPVVAVQAQKIIERATEKRRSKLHVFYTLMATRGARVSTEHVQALNMIDISFNGIKIPFLFRYQSKKEKKVIGEWHKYHGILNERFNKENELDLWVVRRDEQFIKLLHSLSESLGFDFEETLLKKGGYTPIAHGDAETAQLTIRDNLAKILSGQQSIPMAVTHFPFSNDAIELQEKVQSALLDSLSGNNPLKIKIEEHARNIEGEDKLV